MRLLGITMAYNEQDCIANALRLLLDSGHEVHVFDHGSTDKTEQICLDHVKDGVFYHYINRAIIPASIKGVKSPALWRYLGKFARSVRSQFDWVTWLAADEILRLPDGSLPTARAFEREMEKGTQVIRPLVREFRMTDADVRSQKDFRMRLCHYVVNWKAHSPRGWLTEMTPRVMPDGLHIQDRATGKRVRPRYGFWPAGTRVSNNTWLLDHYPLRTVEQATRKVMKERNWVTRTGAQRYGQLYRNKCRNLIKEATSCRLQKRPLPMPAL